MLEFLSSSRLNTILPCGWATFCLSIHPLPGTWVAPTFWLSWGMLTLLDLACKFRHLSLWVSGKARQDSENPQASALLSHYIDKDPQGSLWS